MTKSFGWHWEDAGGVGPKALEHLDSRYNANKVMFKSAIEFFDTQMMCVFGVSTWVSGQWHVRIAEDKKVDIRTRQLV